MADNTTEEPKKKLTLGGGRGKLELKRAGGEQVRQSFSHGRSKAVTVETKRKKRAIDATPLRQETAAPLADAPAPETEAGGGKRVRALTAEEREARLQALREAAADAARDRSKQEAEEAERKLEEAKAEIKAAEAAEAKTATPPSDAAAPASTGAREALDPNDIRAREQAELRQLQESERAAAEATRKEAEERRKAEETERKREHEERTTMANRAGQAAAAKIDALSTEPDDDSADRRRRRRGGGGPVVPGAAAKPSRGRTSGPRKAGRITVTEALNTDDADERVRSLASMRRARAKERRAMMGDEPQVKMSRDVIIPETITVQELANRMAERAADVVKSLMKMGVMATVTQSIDADTAELLVSEFGHKPRRVSESDVEIGIEKSDDAEGDLQPRAPVVTVMGHVDHGKTSLLDALRQTDVVAGEAGGITQHIGAYQVQMESGDRITFLDTPGHAAFTQMRARGANVTDIAIIVVAADDSVMPQTIEAINHARAARVPIIIAINKIDLPDSDPQKVRQQLLQHDIVVEDLGGDVQAVDVSAKSKIGLDKLEEAILLQAEILELRANPAREARGIVIESKVERGRGSVATVLINSGTLRQGDIFIAGDEWGRVRALVNDRGEQVSEAGPAMPIEVLGLQGTPSAGDELVVVENESRARDIAEFRQRKRREVGTAIAARGSVETMFDQFKAGTKKELALVLKADVHGSVEAIAGALEKLAENNEEVSVRILHTGVGAINESDITLASASDGLVVGFNVRANSQAREQARQASIDIRYYSVIYNIIDDVEGLLTGMLAPQTREVFIGNAEIRQIFNITKVGKVAGCYVTDGIVKRGAGVRLLRDNVVIHQGTLKTLKRFKDEVKEVREGMECGMAFENYDDIKDGDVIEAYEVEEVARSL